ncbi:MAG TPA: hypothetical protein PLY52_03070 [Methanothrix sp.]|nr:hypothetical protein [Methanothrix sp.]
MIENCFKGIVQILCLLVLTACLCLSSGQGNQHESITIVSNVDPIIKITNPTDGEIVSDPVSISGTITGKISDDQYMWILVNPEITPGQYWPQGDDHIIPVKGSWSSIAYLGGNSREKKNILVALVDKKTNQDIRNWVIECKKTGKWPGLNFPDNAKIIDKITVIKE